MTYREYKSAKSKEVNDLPIFWAFGREQFKEAMEKRGLAESDTDKIYAFGAGGYYLRTDAPIIRAFFSKKDELPELMKEFAFAEDALYYEMCNHEYSINWQRNWDVFRCFAECELKYYEDDYMEEEAIGKYFDDLGWGEETRKAFFAARKRYFKDAKKNGWY